MVSIHRFYIYLSAECSDESEVSISFFEVKRVSDHFRR